MGATCACGKAITQGGNRVVRHGLSKKSGGIGLHTTGISPRTFKRNAQMMKVRRPNGSVRRMKVCTKCIKAGMYEKAP